MSPASAKLVKRVALAIDRAPQCFTRYNDLQFPPRHEVFRFDDVEEIVVLRRFSLYQHAEDYMLGWNRRQRALEAINALKEGIT